jgi:hypothetical protein
VPAPPQTRPPIDEALIAPIVLPVGHAVPWAAQKVSKIILYERKVK